MVKIWLVVFRHVCGFFFFQMNLSGAVKCNKLFIETTVFNLLLAWSYIISQ